MKILLDESAPQKLRLLIDQSRHMVVTTSFRGWSGLKNGALLLAADQDGFELLITADQELSYQQNLAARRIAVADVEIREPGGGNRVDGCCYVVHSFFDDGPVIGTEHMNTLPHRP